jgi:hypothetical protein
MLAVCGYTNTKDVATFVGRSKANNSDNLSIGGSGNKRTGQSQKGIIYTTKMKIHLTINWIT